MKLWYIYVILNNIRNIRIGDLVASNYIKEGDIIDATVDGKYYRIHVVNIKDHEYLKEDTYLKYDDKIYKSPSDIIQYVILFLA